MAEPLTSAVAAGGWECQSCTFVNPDPSTAAGHMVCQACGTSPAEQAVLLAAMTAGDRAAALVAMPPEARAATLTAMTQAQQAAALAAMSKEDATAAFAALCRTAAEHASLSTAAGSQPTGSEPSVLCSFEDGVFGTSGVHAVPSSNELIAAPPAPSAQGTARGSPTGEPVKEPTTAADWYALGQLPHPERPSNAHKCYVSALDVGFPNDIQAASCWYDCIAHWLYTSLAAA